MAMRRKDPRKEAPVQAPVKVRVTGVGPKPDPKYGSLLLSKFINCVMKDGKKSTAQRLVYSALSIAAERIGEEPMKVFNQALENVKPLVEVKSRRVGGANYQVPIPVESRRQVSLAIRWILQAAHAKSGKAFDVILANELNDAFKKEGAAMTMRENTHRMAEANKAFAHFAW